MCPICLCEFTTSIRAEIICPGQSREVNSITVHVISLMQSLSDCNSTLFSFCLSLPASFRTEEDRRVELCYRAGRGHRSREAGHRLETRHQSGRGDGHRRHHQLPHSDFPRVASGQRLLQRLGAGGLNRVKWTWVGGREGWRRRLFRV